MLTLAERQTLKTIANPERPDSNESACGACLPRSHLEKFSRLDLIEPASPTLTLSVKGQKILFGGK